MTSRLHLIEKAGAKVPGFVSSNLCYETVSGSVAYGISNDTSDQDSLGFCIPLKSHLFPSICGEIEGFGHKLGRFDQFVKHGFKIESTNYDVSVYNIAKFFNLAALGNINVLESLFTPIDCVTYQNPIGVLVRNNRNLFLSKKIKHSVIGYAYSQRAQIRNTKRVGSRKELVEKYGWDTKFLAHTLRLLDYGEQILTTKTLDLRHNNEVLKAARRGEITPDQVDQLFSEKEILFEKLYHESDLPYEPDWEKIKELLLNCVEHHYGRQEILEMKSKYEEAIRKIGEIVNSL